MKSKTIILSSPKKFSNNSPRAILTFISSNNKTEGKIRLYNLDSLPSSTKLGIYYNEQVYSSDIFKREGVYNFISKEHFNLDNNIYCALINTEANNEVVLAGGSPNDFTFTAKIEEVEEDPIEEPVKTETCSCDCANCIYKEYFFNNQPPSDKEEIQLKNANTEDSLATENQDNADTTITSNEEIIEETIIENAIKKEIFEEAKDIVNEESVIETLTDSKEQLVNDADNDNEAEKFLKAITEQLDDMFKNYPEDENLMKIIPNSRIVQLKDSIDQSSYIVGVIYEDDEIKYLLYGVPSSYNSLPPKELGENYQWLPINLDDPLSDGYYITYQDATSGKIVPIKVE